MGNLCTTNKSSARETALTKLVTLQNRLADLVSILQFNGEFFDAQSRTMIVMFEQALMDAVGEINSIIWEVENV